MGIQLSLAIVKPSAGLPVMGKIPIVTSVGELTGGEWIVTSFAGQLWFCLGESGAEKRWYLTIATYHE
jgi:hypothetical protein